MTQYEIEVDYATTRERIDRKVFQTPVIIRYFEDGKLKAEIRS